MKDPIEWTLFCPICQTSLLPQAQRYLCLSCGNIYPVEDGVVRFISKNEFYENRYSPKALNFNPDESNWHGRILLYLAGMHYFWYIRKYVPLGAKLLDLAGGAGMYFLANRYQTVGLDVSFTSTREMSKTYSLALQCDATHIPLGNQVIDAIVSRFFFEHIQLDEKRKVLRESWRLLKPDGRLIVLQDCDCNNPLWLWAKDDSSLFQRNFIDRDGHYGLLYPSQNLVLLEQAGFQIVEQYAANKTFLVTPSMIGWLQDYRNKNWLSGFLLGMVKPVNNNRILNLVYSLLMTAWDDLVEKLLPLDHARYLLVACKKIG
jgi:ubiquinone/menaquinone biosynthesis C-methylase UbiE